jgi:ABC-type antimicrobial peptide transport system permease subunit
MRKDKCRGREVVLLPSFLLSLFSFLLVFFLFFFFFFFFSHSLFFMKDQLQRAATYGRESRSPKLGSQSFVPSPDREPSTASRISARRAYTMPDLPMFLALRHILALPCHTSTSF